MMVIQGESAENFKIVLHRRNGVQESKKIPFIKESIIEDLLDHFSLLEEKAAAKKCDAMAGLLEEANGIIEDTDAGTMIRDAGLIRAAQKVEHYEIATYGTLKVLAESMGHTQVAELLGQTLENEKVTDVALTECATTFVNEAAAQE
jgi:ferritin-like metal-binding protein YciE